MFHLIGGTEDNDLWVNKHINEDDQMVLQSVWVPTAEERLAIAAGDNIELTVWGLGTPPVEIRTTDVQLGKRPRSDTPTPGSEEAVREGCLCSMQLNRDGVGVGEVDIDGVLTATFSMNQHCPLHGEAVNYQWRDS